VTKSRAATCRALACDQSALLAADAMPADAVIGVIGCNASTAATGGAANAPAAFGANGGVINDARGTGATSSIRVSVAGLDCVPECSTAVHSPHQSSSRICGQTPSTMYAFAGAGFTVGSARLQRPQRWAAPSSARPLSRS
jgi:hypothetical protein